MQALFKPINSVLTPALVLLALTSSCASHREVSNFAGLSPTQARTLAAHLAFTRNIELHEDLQSAFAIHPPKNVLVISGGDAHGAFGAGVLAGWRQSPADPRPKFDVVTGVSTGALMSPFAFLGAPPDDEAMRDLYLHVRDQDIFGWMFSGLPDALFDTGPLRRLIAQHVTPQVLRRIAEAHRQGRRLYVATVEIDSGDLVIWPMSRLADEAVGPDGQVDARKLEKFRRILLASASIPMAFAPVEIDGGLHVDAGESRALFLMESMLGSAGSESEATRPADAPAIAPTVWVIFCGQLRAHPEAVSLDLPSLGLRSMELYFHAVEILSLQEAAYLAASHDPPYRFRWIAEPPSNAPALRAPGLFKPMFDPKVMARLYDTGDTLARTNHAWHNGAPSADALGEPTTAP